MISEVFRFVGVGLLASIVHVCGALLAKAALPLGGQGANLFGFCLAVFVSYFAHAHVTLRIKPDHGAHFPRFAVSALAGLACSSFVTWLVADWLGQPFWLAMLFVAMTVPPFTFLLVKLWVFRPAAADRGRALMGWGLAAGGALAFLWYFWGRILNHDIAWYLIATRDWLDGARLYVDISEVNPPLNFYYTVPAVLLSEIGGFSLTNAQYLVFSCLLFVSLLWSWQVLSASNRLGLQRQVAFQLVLTFALIVPPLGNAVQREHLFVAFVLPWLLGQIPGRRNPKEGEVGRAIFAAMGICLKPHFILLPLFVGLWNCWREGSLRALFAPGNLIIAGIGSLYVIGVRLVHPEYLSHIVPMALEVYGAYGGSLGKVVGRFAPIPTALLILAFLLALRSRRGAPEAGLFWMAALAGLGCYLWQGTGFRYHLIPFFSFASVGLGWFLVTAQLPGLLTIVCVLALAVIGFVNLAMGPYRSIVVETLTPHLQGRKSLTVLTSYVHAGPPLALALEAHWSSGYSSLWLAPGAVNGLAEADCMAEPGRCETLRQIADFQRRDVIRDLEKGKPEVIIVDKRSGYFHTPDFDWLDFMAQDAAFATVMGRYHLSQSLERFDLWVRNDL